MEDTEVVSLRHDRSGRPQVLDFRPEADYNVCHIVDVVHVDAGVIGPAPVRGLPVDAVRLLVSNGESAANAAWKQLAALGTTNVRVLSGGMNLWLDIFKDGRLEAAAGAPDAETLRRSFPAALGPRSLHADPDPAIVAGRKHEKVVESQAMFRPPQAMFRPPQAMFRPPQAMFRPPQAMFRPPQAMFRPPQGGCGG